MVFITSVSVVSADSSAAGTSGAQFLKISVDARQSALGGAGATVSGSQSMFYNPAGLSSVANFDLSLTQVNWFQDIRYSNLSAAKKFNFGVIGFSINYLTSSSIDKYDNTGTMLNETYDVSDTALGLGYATEIYKGVSVGGNVKYLTDRIETHTANALSFNCGLVYREIVSKLDLGIAIQNIGSEVKYISVGDPQPLTYKLGAAYNIPVGESDEPGGVIVCSDVNSANDTGIYANFGLEIYKEFTEDSTYFIRGGYRTDLSDKANGVSLGVGLKYNIYVIDYAYSALGDLGQATRITVSLRFN